MKNKREAMKIEIDTEQEYIPPRVQYVVVGLPVVLPSGGRYEPGETISADAIPEGIKASLLYAGNIRQG